MVMDECFLVRLSLIKEMNKYKSEGKLLFNENYYCSQVYINK